MNMIGSFQVGVAIILEQSGKVLIGKRSSMKDFGAELWEFPAGRLDHGESPEEAIIREGGEELGVQIEPVHIIDAYGFKRAEHDMILLTYYCQFSGELKKSAEHDNLAWVSPEKAREAFQFPQQQQSIDKFLDFKRRGMI